MMRGAHVDFSTDGCKTKADVDARREFLKMAARHQERTHHFSDEDLRGLLAAGHEVQRVRISNARRRLASWRRRHGSKRWYV